MKLLALPTAMALMMGCGASTPVTQYPGIKKDQHVETKKLPDRPDKQAIPKAKDWVKPLKAGESHTADGILLSPEKAVRAALWKSGYNECRSLHEIDRGIFGHHRVVYEERLVQANKEVSRLSPSWWDENKGTISWAGGFLMGAAATIAIVYALDEVRQ